MAKTNHNLSEDTRTLWSLLISELEKDKPRAAVWRDYVEKLGIKFHSEPADQIAEIISLRGSSKKSEKKQELV